MDMLGKREIVCADNIKDIILKILIFYLNNLFSIIGFPSFFVFFKIFILIN